MIESTRFLYLDPNDVTLDESNCANISTLTTSLFSRNAIEYCLENLDHFGVVSEALKLVYTRDYSRGI
jgi:hypothetical protein